MAMACLINYSSISNSKTINPFTQYGLWFTRFNMVIILWHQKNIITTVSELQNFGNDCLNDSYSFWNTFVTA